MEISKVGIRTILLDFFRIDMNHLDLTIVTNSTVYQGLVYREIGILEVHVFPYHSNPDLMFWIQQSMDDFFPFVQFRSRGV